MTRRSQASQAGGFQFAPARPGQAQGPLIRVLKPPFSAWIVSHNVIGHMCHWLVTDRTSKPYKGNTVPCLAHQGYCAHCAGVTDSQTTPHWRGWLTAVPLGIRRVAVIEVRARHVQVDERLDPAWQGSLRGTRCRGLKEGRLATSPVELYLDDQPGDASGLPQDMDRVAWLTVLWSDHLRAHLLPQASTGEHLMPSWNAQDCPDPSEVPNPVDDSSGIQ